VQPIHIVLSRAGQRDSLTAAGTEALGQPWSVISRDRGLGRGGFQPGHCDAAAYLYVKVPFGPIADHWYPPPLADVRQVEGTWCPGEGSHGAFL